MSSCIKCQASLQEVSKFCRRCGAEQVIKPEQKAGANDITSSFSVDNKPSTVSSIDIVTDHTTKKMTTNPLPSPPINAVTMPMTQIVEQKRKQGLLIGVGIFLVMIAFGAAMTYGVIYHLNSLRTNLPSIKKTSKPSTGVKALKSETTATPISTPTATPVFTPAPTATPESFPTPPKPTPSSEPIKERPKVSSPEIKKSDEARKKL
ncbi:MAG: zinc ribbon domain-containing protein [Acidobacteria bacterium]|nr:zinc ribbon domain-containing protein [Acidobacteriota bacterium]